MMKNIWIFLICGIVLSVMGCEKNDAQVFEDEARVCFFRGEDGTGQQDSILQSFFVLPETQERDTVIARIPVIFLRDVSLKTEKRRLEMTIVENDYFKRGIDADCDFMIQTTELAEEPTNWASTWKSYFGEWSSQKMWFIVTYLGLDDFEAEYDAGYKKYLKQKAHSKLNEYNETHDEPLCNDPTKHHENGEQCENCVVFP